jgi:hypothetical protein
MKRHEYDAIKSLAHIPQSSHSLEAAPSRQANFNQSCSAMILENTNMVGLTLTMEAKLFIISQFY